MSAGRAAQLVIFDCDGVLVDSEPISIDVLLAALAEAGVIMTGEEAYERFLGKSLKTMSDILDGEYGLAIDDAFLDRMRHVLYDRFRHELRAIDGVGEAIDGLPIACCVASSSQLERIRLSLTITGLIDRLEPNIFSASMVSRGKPAPDLFLHASRSMGVSAENCIVIEDSPAGVEAAKSAGMAVFAFAGGTHAQNRRHREALARLEPDILFDDMRELIHFVEKRKGNGKEA